MRISTNQIPTLPIELCAAALLGAILVAYGLPEPQFEATQGGIAVLEPKVLQLPANSALGKRELSAALGQKAVSGQLNKVVRKLLAAELIEPTVPNQLNSRLQQYRLKNAKRLSKANTVLPPTTSAIIQ